MKSSPELLKTIDEIRKKQIEKSYLLNRLLLAQKDSVYLCLDPEDSLLTMEISGVVVRACKLTDIHISQRLRCLDQKQLLAWCSTPFTLRNDLATVPKVQYIIKKAPKDTIEAALQSSKPIPPDTSTVYFTLFFDRNLVVDVEQTDSPYPEDKKVIKHYFRTKQKASRQKVLYALFHGRPPDPTITIQLKLNKADAMAIYRGIPAHSALALKLP